MQSLKQIKEPADRPKEQRDDPVPNDEEVTANEAAIYISSDDDGSNTDPDTENHNNFIDALVDDGAPKASEKGAEFSQPVEFSQVHTALQRTLPKDEHKFENVLK